MKIKYLMLVLFCFLLTNIGISQGPPCVPLDLRCNGLTNPTDITDLTPELSWTFDDENPGETQSAYRLLVSSNQSILNSDIGSMWDTNKVYSSVFSAEYGGSELQYGTTYYWKVKTWNSVSSSTPYSTVATFTMTSDLDCRCYYGTPLPIPGKIEIEDFDPGGEGVAYHDTDTINQGGQYRTGEGVDIYESTDTGGGYYIGDTAPGEWLEYTVEVYAAGTYMIEARVASDGLGGTFHIELDGVDKTGTMQIPDTGGWQNWQNINVDGVPIDTGVQIMRIVMDTAHSISSNTCGNLNYIDIHTGPLPPPLIVVTSPNGGETWIIGTKSIVTWNTVITPLDINIELSTSGTSGPWIPLISNTTNDLAEEVTVPDMPSTTCCIRVKYTDYPVGDISNSNFTINTDYYISGYVVDEASVGVKGVLLAIYNSDHSFSTGTITSDSGYYVFTGLSLGEDYTIYPVALPSENVDITVNPSILRFDEVEAGQSKTLPLEISISPSIVKIKSIIPTRIDIVSLSSSLENQNFTMVSLPDMAPYVIVVSYYQWIEIEPTSFIGSSSTVNITVNNSVLNKKDGNHSGTIYVYVMSSTNTAQVTVNVTATCVLTRPNPYNHSSGNLTFFGDGIVPNDTKIKIYTLSGEFVRKLEAGDESEITWDGTDKKGNTITNGIYIYTYESPKEKGIDKFTVIK